MADWVRVSSTDECPPGQVFPAEAGGKRIVLCNVDGDFYALIDRCSHQEFPLSDGELAGSRLECALHGAKFDVCTGRAVQLPAVAPVKTFPVEVRDSDVFVHIE